VLEEFDISILTGLMALVILALAFGRAGNHPRPTLTLGIDSERLGLVLLDGPSAVRSNGHG
jgi:hypothetical protein